MKTAEAEQLKAGQKVSDRRYGEAEVVKYLPRFGVVVHPLTPAGAGQLAADCRASVPNVLRDVRCLTAITERSEKP